jgi:glutathione S-transferase
MVFKRPGDESIAAAAEREELPLILDYLETVMPEGDGFLIGDRLTLADIAIASPFATLGHTGIEVVEQDHPKLARFLKRMFSRPSFSACIERERAFMERFAA